MSSIGYYRYKVLADSVKTISLNVNNTTLYTMNVVPISACSGYKLLKYLDSKGMYRFFPFSNYYQVSDNPTLIGSANKFITSILTDQSNKHNVGYSNERKLELSAKATNEQLETLSDIYTSPRIYLYIGFNNSDTASDWLEVTVQSSDNIVRKRKGDLATINLTVTLPEYYTIKMI